MILRAGCQAALHCPTCEVRPLDLRHIACPLTVIASIRAVPERMLTFMSLLERGLLQKRFGDPLAITCHAEAVVKGLL